MSGDGIYFQTFTETNEEKFGDIVIADAAVKLVNQTSDKLLKKYPNLPYSIRIACDFGKGKA